MANPAESIKEESLPKQHLESLTLEDSKCTDSGVGPSECTGNTSNEASSCTSSVQDVTSLDAANTSQDVVNGVKHPPIGNTSTESANETEPKDLNLPEPSADDQSDAGGFGKLPLSEEQPAFPMRYDPVRVLTHSPRDSLYYKMSAKIRGHCLIFNHKYFNPELGMNTRKGTNNDRDAIERLFKQLGFQVSVFNDLTLVEFNKTIVKYSQKVDHSAFDCIAVFFLSHGEEGSFFCKDSQFKQENLFEPFEGDKCTTLAGKPKLFFIQACRGSQLESGVEMFDQTDGISFSHKLPSTADVMTMWSTTPGYFSWRNTTNGSWFIQSLVQVLSTEAHKLPLAVLHTMVNRHMIYHFESNTPSDLNMHRMKQCSILTSTATRMVHFFPPPENKQA